MAVTRKVKMKIIKRLKDGDRVAHIADEFEIAESTVRTIKNELMPTTDVPKEEVANDDSDSIRASITPEFISTVVKPLAINNDGDLYEPKDDEVFKHNSPVSDDDEEDDKHDDIDFVKALMVGADKAIIYRKTIKVTIEFNTGGGEQ